MATQTLTDPELASLTAALALDAPATKSEWEARLGQRVQGVTHAAFTFLRSARGDQALHGSRVTLATDAEFYRLVGSDTALFRLMLEGRLGYYDAILPRVAAIVARGPHSRIADLGSHGGLTSLYLAKRFPASQIVAIERCPEAVRRAQEFQHALRVHNVRFIQGDYTAESTEEACDVVLSLQTMPTYMLPRVLSASPEHFLRGENLARTAGDTSSPATHLARCLAAVRHWCRPGGRALLHERSRDFPFTALFLYLAARAGLRVAERVPVTWRTSNERDSDQTAPLVVTEAQEGPAPFDEPALLASTLPRTDPASMLGPEVRQGIHITGPRAQSTFAALEGRCGDLCVEVVLKNGQRCNVHLGVTEAKLAYVYTCTNLDFREFKICDAAHRRALFEPAVQYIERMRNAAELASVSHEPAVLHTLLHPVVENRKPPSP